MVDTALAPRADASARLAVESDAADEPRMLDLVDRLARIALWIAAVAAFGSAFLLLLIGHDRQWQAWVAVGIPLAIWVGGLRAGRHRAAIQTLACALLMLSPLIAGDTGATDFIALDSVAFATIFPAVIAFRPPAAIATVFGVASLLVVLAIVDPPGVVVGATAVDAVVGGLFCLVIGLGSILTRAQWVPYLAKLDEQQRARRIAQEIEHREVERADARAAVERRIHETVLNTLSGLSLGVGVEGRPAAISACQRDLEQLELGLHDVTTLTPQGVVDAALAVDSDGGPRIDADVEGSVPLPPAVALSLRDALTECLRNVRRHAHANSVGISSRVLPGVDGERIVEMQVRDDGIGMPADADERFGLRSTVRAAMMQMGGEAIVSATPGGGTTVTLRVPVSAVPASPPPPSVTTLLGISRLGRFGLLAGIAVLLLVTPVLAEPMGIGWFAVPAVTILAVVNVAMALNWESRWRLPLALVSVSLIVAVLLVAAMHRPTCDVWPQVNWMAGILCGAAAALAFIAPRTQLGRVLMIAALTVAGLALVYQLPASCQAGPFISVTTAAAYLFGLWLVVQWGDNTFAATRVRAATQWQRILAARAQTVRAQEMAQGWNQVGHSSRDLLAGIAGYRLDPADPAVRSRATAQAALIRGRLGLEPLRQSGVEQLVASVTRVADAASTRVDAEYLTPLTRRDSLPAEFCLALERLADTANGGLVVIRAAESDGQEDVVVTASSEAMTAAGVRLLPENVEDCTVVVFDDDVDPTLSRLLISRPVASV